MKRSKFVREKAEDIKARTRGAIGRDRAELKNSIIKEPLQPFLKFMLDVASDAIAAGDYSKNNINIQNKKAGLKFVITRMPELNEINAQYEIVLYKGNEIRFKGNVINGSTVGDRQWFFTQKYEDIVSKTDVQQFIKATAILFATLRTSVVPTMKELIEWTILQVSPKAHEYKYNHDATVSFQKNDDYIDCTLDIQGIVLYTCKVRLDVNGIPSVVTDDTLHEMPQHVLDTLCGLVRSGAKDKLIEIQNRVISEQQEQFYGTHEGIHYHETAILNDIFKSYMD